jgi:hypothetical protein
MSEQPKPVTVLTTPTEDRAYCFVECDACGPMGLFESEGISTLVYSHLINIHDIDTTTITITNPEQP